MSFFYPTDLVKLLSEHPHLDDGCDRSHRFYMPIMLLTACSVLGLKQFAGDPIHCYTSSNLNNNQVDYVKNFCWTASTYQILETDYDTFRLPKGTDHLLSGTNARTSGSDAPQNSVLKGTKVFVSYYQWVPVFLAIQAVLFHVPYLIWYSYIVRGSVHLPHIMNGAYNLAKVQSNPIARRTALEDTAYLLDAHFHENMESLAKADSLSKPDFPADKNENNNNSVNNSVKKVSTSVKRGFKIAKKWRPIGHFTLYLLVKMAYLANVVFQLFCLHSFLKLDIFTYSLDVFRTMVFGHTWVTSTRFPIRTLCEFQGLPQIHGYLLPHTCHCVLPINLYNDKIFAGLTFIIALLGICSCINLALWVFGIYGYATRYSLVKDLISDGNNLTIKRFVNQYLQTDGLFIIHLLNQNVGRNTAKEIVNALFKKYSEFLDSTSCPSSYESCQKNSFEAGGVSISVNGGINGGVSRLQSHVPKSVLRCFSCDLPWDEKDEGRPCVKCRNILSSQP